MKKALATAVVLTALAAGSMPAHAQKGEVVLYGYKGPNMEASKVAFEKLYPNVEVKIVTGDTGSSPPGCSPRRTIRAAMC